MTTKSTATKRSAPAKKKPGAVLKPKRVVFRHKSGDVATVEILDTGAAKVCLSPASDVLLYHTIEVAPTVLAAATKVFGKRDAAEVVRYFQGAPNEL